MARLAGSNPRINQADLALYLTAAVLGLGIVVFNHYSDVNQSVAKTGKLETYLEMIIARMDRVSDQVSTWGAIDIQQEVSRR